MNLQHSCWQVAGSLSFPSWSTLQWLKGAAVTSILFAQKGTEWFFRPLNCIVSLLSAVFCPSAPPSWCSLKPMVLTDAKRDNSTCFSPQVYDLWMSTKKYIVTFFLMSGSVHRPCSHRDFQHPQETQWEPGWKCMLTAVIFTKYIDCLILFHV